MTTEKTSVAAGWNTKTASKSRHLKKTGEGRRAEVDRRYVKWE